ncbi:outer membrane lipoprotein carrier protein LolA [Cellvibrio japonicus]|nr:outer membrane lipoprotein carrier protein LolA [Cellvibrio japonicus]
MNSLLLVSKSVCFFSKALCLWLVLAAVHGRAAEPTQERIDQVVQRLGEIVFIRGDFVQEKTLKGLPYALRAQGTFIFWQNQGLYQATEKPFFNAFTITRDALINWQADGTGSLSREQPAIMQREVNKTLLAFFSADIALIQQRFNTEWQFTDNQWHLTLTPRLELIAKNMRSVELAGDHLLQSIRVLAANGDETRIQFSNQQPATEPTAGDCRWFFLPPDTRCTELANQP